MSKGRVGAGSDRKGGGKTRQETLRTSDKEGNEDGGMERQMAREKRRVGDEG